MKYFCVLHVYMFLIFLYHLLSLSQVVEANLNGEMNLKIETDLVSVTTHFKDLGNPPWGEFVN